MEKALWITRDMDGIYAMHETEPIKDALGNWSMGKGTRRGFHTVYAEFIFGEIPKGTRYRIIAPAQIVADPPAEVPQACPCCGGPTASFWLSSNNYRVRCEKFPRGPECLVGPERPTSAEAIHDYNRISFK